MNKGIKKFIIRTFLPGTPFNAIKVLLDNDVAAKAAENAIQQMIDDETFDFDELISNLDEEEAMFNVGYALQFALAPFVTRKLNTMAENRVLSIVLQKIRSEYIS